MPVELAGVLPREILDRSLTLHARDATYDQLLQAIGIAGGVYFSYVKGGIAVSTESGKEFAAGNAGEPSIQADARKLIIGRLQLNDANVSEVLAYLETRAAQAGNGRLKPFFVIRHDCTPRRGVTLDVRNVSLEEAVRAVCLVADLEETWFPWGAGIGNPRTNSAAPGSGVSRE